MAEPDARFEVIWSERNRDIVRRLGKKAIQAGLIDEFVAAVKHIERMLETEPLSWGDPHYRLPASGIMVYHRIHGMFHVSYGVDEPSRLVFVKDLQPFPGSGLAG